METPQLTPGYFMMDHRMRDETVEAQIYGEAQKELLAALSIMLLEDVFEATAVAPRMRDHLVDTMGAIPEKLVRREMERTSYSGSSLLLEAYGIPAPENPSRDDVARHWQGPLLVPLPKDFGNDMLDQVKNMDESFADLEAMHTVFADTKLLALMRKFQRLGLDTDAPAEDAADVAFNQVQEMLFNPDYTLPKSHEQSIYMLCFVPSGVRQIVKEALIGNQVIQKMADNLGEDVCPEDAAVLDALKTAFTANALSGHNWNLLTARAGISEETAVEMALISAKRYEALEILQRLNDKHQGTHAMEAYRAAAATLAELVDTMDKHARYGYGIFANTDVDHGFSGFRDDTILDALGESKWTSGEYVSPEKNGQKAVILEDDDRQRAQWHQTVNRFTTYTADEADLYVAPGQELDARIEDQSVGLFLLDIQNGTDELAGIRVGEEILHRRIALWEQAGRPKDFPPTTIRIWSTSPKHVQEADRYFTELLGVGTAEWYADDHIRFNGLDQSAGGDVPINLDIRHKQWNEIGDVAHRKK